MTWVFDVLLAAVLFSIVSLFDKYWCSDKFESAFSYSFAGFCSALVLLFSFIPLLDLSRLNFIAIIGIATYVPVYFFMWLLWYKSLNVGDVSRNTAVFNTAPLFTLLLQLAFLHEKVSMIQIFAILLIVGGVVAITVRRSKKHENTHIYMYVLAAAILSAVGNIISKSVIVSVGPYNFFFFSYVIMIPLYLSFLFIPRVKKEISRVIHEKGTIGLLLLRGVFFVGATYLYFHSLLTGSVSLVAAINGSRPVFVFVFGSLISMVVPAIKIERLSLQDQVKKVAGIVATSAGVVLISLFR
jgi:drug/metabolite transporter (DMT)-like permease